MTPPNAHPERFLDLCPGCASYVSDTDPDGTELADGQRWHRRHQDQPAFHPTFLRVLVDRRRRLIRALAHDVWGYEHDNGEDLATGTLHRLEQAAAIAGLEIKIHEK